MDFRKQIDEDISDYQEKYSAIADIKKPEWAFNFWILDKLYSIDEDLIENQIIDYNDVCVDCYEWHEDTRDLYLIQNKFYSEGSNLSLNYINNDFLIRPVKSLENGTYTRCVNLQRIYTSNKDKENFTVHLHLYITNNSSKNKTITDAIEKFNSDNCEKGCVARIFWLDDIRDQYYDEPLTKKQSMKFKIESINNGTVMNIDSENYGIDVKINARYVFTPILNLYDLYRQSVRENYPLFDANIRDYLGSTGAVNKAIAKTLSTSDRQNFFYYNNGITMIVKKMGKIKTEPGQTRSHVTIEVTNPQIVNGCQTVSTIYETLSALPESNLKEMYQNTFVMLKVLEIPSNASEYIQLSQDIVRYNNSQNALNVKWFESSSSEFKRIQNEFLKKGFLVCIKQSDKHSFVNEYKSPSELISNNQQLLDLFGITHKNKTKEFMIDLDKLLQIFLSFSDSHEAINHKSQILKANTAANRAVIEFIKDPKCTTNALLSLLLLYLRLEQENSSEKMKVNSFMVIHCFGKFTCEGDASRIKESLDTPEKINHFIAYYSKVMRSYNFRWSLENQNKGYNDFIKIPLNFESMEYDLKMSEVLF